MAKSKARSGSNRSAKGSALPAPFVVSQRALIVALLALNAFLFSRATVDHFSLPRATVVVIACVLLVGLSALRFVTAGRLVLPRSPVVVLVGLFVAALVLATVVSDLPARSVLGPYTRYTGLVAYGAYAVLLLAVIRAFDARSVQQIAWVLLAGLAIVASYGLLQQVGADPLEWPQRPPSEIHEFHEARTDFSTMGNVNFSAAVVGITTPFALWIVLGSARPLWARLAAGAAALGGLVYALVNGSFQGPVTILGSSLVVAAVWLLEHRHQWSELADRTRRFVVGGVIAAVLALLAASPVLVQFAIGEFREAEERVQFWETALDIWQDSPVWGKGLGAFAWEFTQRRQVEHGAARMFQGADSPHNVVLELLAGGGLLVAGTYLAIVGYTGYALVRGLRRLRGEQRLLLAAFGGGWVAYQLQSIVSIDVPALAVLHWVLAGAIIVLAAPPRLVERQVFQAATVRGGRAARRRGRPTTDANTLIAQGAVVLVVLGLLWPVMRPLRADLAARDAHQARAVGNFAAMHEHAERAVDLAPWQDTYWVLTAAALDSMGRLEEAMEAGQRASEKAPGNAFYATSVAVLAERLERSEEAGRWFEEALRRDPHNPRVIEAVAGFRLDQGEPEVAVELLLRATEIAPQRAEGWALLAVAYRELGESRRAAEAEDRALELDPDLGQEAGS